MVRVTRPGGKQETFTPSSAEAVLGWQHNNGDLAIVQLEPRSQMTPAGMQQGVVTTPVKSYARGQWAEVETVEEPGDGLLSIPRPGALESQP